MPYQKPMKTNQTPGERQYARVSRIFPKTDVNAPNAKVRVLVTDDGEK